MVPPNAKEAILMTKSFQAEEDALDAEGLLYGQDIAD